MKQNIKKEIINNILVTMSVYIKVEDIQILEILLTEQLSKVNLEEISTLPVAYRNETDQKNQYVIQLFIIKKKIKDNTKKAYLDAVKRLITLIDKPLESIDETDISMYLHWYERKNIPAGGRKNQGSTVNNERRFLSAFFTWMRKEHLILDNPVESTEPVKVTRKPIDYFHPEEIAKLRDACRNPRERALVETLRSTGARNGELIEITIVQINWITGDILILSEKSERYRPLYLDDDARYYIKKYLDTRKDDSPYLFPESRAPYNKMTTCGIRSAFKAIGDRAGVQCRVYPHKMRKTLGMVLKNRGVDIGTIQEIMGHASPAVTAAYYAQSTPQTLRHVRERMAA